MHYQEVLCYLLLITVAWCFVGCEIHNIQLVPALCILYFNIIMILLFCSYYLD